MPACKYHDPHCPCQDGDACHYEDCGDTKAWDPRYVLAAHIADLQARALKLAELVERIPCQVARRGEMTHECMVDNLCDACVIRGELLAMLGETA